MGRADVSLNETGLWQAERIAAALADEAVVAVYASPLQRTMQTAQAIADTHEIAVVPEPGLIEMDIGEMDGLRISDIRDRYPGFLERWMSVDGPAEKLPGGERLIDVADRAWDTLSRLASVHQDETVVAVTHNFALLMMLARLMGIEAAYFRRLRQSLAAITLLDMRPDRARILRLNDTCHLGEQITVP